jgi:hypothetical protein
MYNRSWSVFKTSKTAGASRHFASFLHAQLSVIYLVYATLYAVSPHIKKPAVILAHSRCWSVQGR